MPTWFSPRTLSGWSEHSVQLVFLSSLQFVCESGKLTHKLYSYLSSEWNIIDLTYLPLIAVGFVLNKTGSHDSARIVYGLVTLLMWVRVIRLYQAVDKLGTLWIMMRKMVSETKLQLQNRSHIPQKAYWGLYFWIWFQSPRRNAREGRARNKDVPFRLCDSALFFII